MNWAIFSTTFMTIFLAEMGDKTQFASFAIASQTKSTLSVLTASILALSLASTLGVLAGSFIGNYISAEKMKLISGITFLIMGIFIIIKK